MKTQYKRFTSFVVATGTTKVQQVEAAKAQASQAYDVTTDFYLQMRRGLPDAMRNGGNRAALSAVLQAVTNPKKLTSYTPILEGVRRWVRTDNVTWNAKAPSGTWSSGNLDVSITPDLDVLVNGVPTMVKTYFEKTPLSQQRADVIVHLLRQTVPGSHEVLVLDTRAGRRFTFAAADPRIAVLLPGEAASFVSIWNAIP